ncbi:MAG TPA: polynucleotide kinase-phosphatase [Acidimicrobiales bacterium]|nr:polynucleotide kinase-phosphatase [Acidimicrobiales bacterium]
MSGSTITIPDLALVALVGASGAGKSTFAARHFAPSEVLSSDFCRLLVADDENDQAATPAAFDVLGYIAGKRLEAGRLTVVDATSVQRDARAQLIGLAREHHVLPVAIVLDVPEKVCAERNAARPDRDLPAHAVRRQHQQLRRSIKGLQREGFRRVYVLRGTDEIDAATIERERRWTDRRHEHGPFDFVGDVHGCADELVALLGELGYDVAPDRSTARHPGARTAFFVGDLVDRGPDSPGVLRLVMGMVRDGTAVCVPGNHENKLGRALAGRKVTVSHGLAETLTQLDAEPEPEVFRREVAAFIDGLVSHAVLDDGRCVVAHAGLPERLHNRSSGAVRAFALYGDTTGETDEFGLPVRYPWANDYRGSAVVVYGHTPVPETEWTNNTICIDTGCVFGGKLTALRYPERELVSVPAARTYWEPARPLKPAPTEAARPAELLDATDVLGKRIVDTRLQPRITIGAENAAAAFEVMSRFAIDPRWLVHLPPTMAPTATSSRPDLLEHPAEAFAAYRRDGVDRAICEEKHMGSRAIVVVCRDAEVAARRFKIDDPVGGTVHTRTGRAFFADPAWQGKVVERTRAAVTAAGLWEELDTDWVVLDTELLPWSAKAEELLRTQYAAVGAAGRAMTTRAGELLATALERSIDVADLAARTGERRGALDGYVDAYRRYCWPVDSPDDLRLAPFVVLAAEGAVLAGRDHTWHMAVADRLAAAGDGFVRSTRNLVVDLGDPGSEAAAVAWWEQLVAAGGEGMVVKPVDSIVTGGRGLVQPGIKCRGPEYLRIIYGPEYRSPDNLDRLRERGLGRKRSLAQREFALGIEALERFVAGEPLHRVHECVFGVLALESEPVDPRL